LAANSEPSLFTQQRLATGLDTALRQQFLEVRMLSVNRKYN
jgi:hypothetical protein